MAAPLLGSNSIYFIDTVRCLRLVRAYGLQLRRSRVPSNGREYTRRHAAFSLGGMVFLVGMIAGTTEFAVFPKPGEPSWRWLLDAGIYTSGVPAITLAVGLWRYRGFETKRALVAGATIFTLVLTPNIVCQAFLMTTGVSQIKAALFASLLFYAPSILLGLSIFDKKFRMPSVWMPLAALYVGAYAVWWLTFGSITLSNGDDLRLLLLLVIVSFWYAAIGYYLQELIKVPPRERDHATSPGSLSTV